MLTKGHDFPGVTLVGIIDADQGLFGTDFRASEKLAQTFVQVAGRAGRGERPGEVYIQTLFPDHPLLQLLIREGYDRFAEAALAERRAAGWPPFSYLAMLRAEATAREPALKFLASARAAGEQLNVAKVRLLGPAPAPMEKRAGRYRAQLLVEAGTRPALQRFLGAWRELIGELPEARQDALVAGRGSGGVVLRVGSRYGVCTRTSFCRRCPRLAFALTRSYRFWRFSQNCGSIRKKCPRRSALSALIDRVPATISPIRRCGTLMFFASRYCVMPIGRRNSLSRISPGWIGGNSRLPIDFAQ